MPSIDDLPRSCKPRGGTGAICFAILRCERAGNPQRTPTYASGCRPARASSGSQLAPVPRSVASSRLPCPRGVGDLAPPRADGLELLGGQDACLEQGGVLRPALGL